MDSFCQFLDAVYAAGCTFWDTADAYMDSEQLIGKWCVVHIIHVRITKHACGRFKRTGKRADIFLSTKFGFMPDLTINGKPEHVREAVESSLAKLGVDSIDLYYLHVCLSSIFVAFRLPIFISSVLTPKLPLRHVFFLSLIILA